MREKQNKGIVRDIIEILIYMILGAIISLLLITYVGQLTKVDGHSMENTLHESENLVLDKISYRFEDPKRFDIVVFPVEADNNKIYIKRVIGLPGEKIQIINGKIYVNEKLLEENYGKEAIEQAGRASEAITLGEDEYFVLGDNRNESADSRIAEVGNVKRSTIIGRAWLRIWPFDQFGVLENK